jgi:hypothetical protein
MGLPGGVARKAPRIISCTCKDARQVFHRAPPIIILTIIRQLALDGFKGANLRFSNSVGTSGSGSEKILFFQRFVSGPGETGCVPAVLRVLAGPHPSRRRAHAARRPRGRERGRVRGPGVRGGVVAGGEPARRFPGFGFSGKPTGTGWDPDHIARAWAELMKRLGYTATSPRAATGAPPSPARWRADE